MDSACDRALRRGASASGAGATIRERRRPARSHSRLQRNAHQRSARRMRLLLDARREGRFQRTHPFQAQHCRRTLRSARCEYQFRSRRSKESLRKPAGMPSGAKAPLILLDLTYGLKPVPFKSSTCRVEMWGGGLGLACLYPALSFAGASLSKPCPVSTSRSSNRTCTFRASGSR